MRVVQPTGTRGSLKWIQRFVAEKPGALQPAALPEVLWLSPLASDGFAEYRDAAFLERIGCGHLAQDLAEFWPARGPQWDALGMTSRGPVLVEAKAHLQEFFSPPSKAGDASLGKIKSALSAVQQELAISPGTDWTRIFFQYANRLAHLWFLHRHGVAADLVFVSFVGDAGMRGPDRPEVWQAAFAAADYALGLPRIHALSRHVHHVHPDTRLLADHTTQDWSNHQS